MDEIDKPEKIDPDNNLVLEPFATDPEKNAAVFAWIDQVFANNSYHKDAKENYVFTFSPFTTSSTTTEAPFAQLLDAANEDYLYLDSEEDRMSHSFMDFELIPTKPTKRSPSILLANTNFVATPSPTKSTGSGKSLDKLRLKRFIVNSK